MNSHESDAFIVIPDVSGYTHFMQLPHTSLEHSQRGISALLESLRQAAGHELVVSKVEGDAILFYRELSPENEEADELRRLRRCIERLIYAFYDKREGLAEELKPGCPACGSLRELDLKIVVHRGRILVHEVFGRREISGPAVIAAHRLLGAARDIPRRIIITDEVGIDFGFAVEKTSRKSEELDDIGDMRFRVLVFDPNQVQP